MWAAAPNSDLCYGSCKRSLEVPGGYYGRLLSGGYYSRWVRVHFFTPDEMIHLDLRLNSIGRSSIRANCRASRS